MLEKLILVILVWKISSQKLVYELQVDHPLNCPNLINQVFPDGRGRNVSSEERGGKVSYLEVGVKTLSQCVSTCCDSNTCQAALLAGTGGEGECRHLSCFSDLDCQPVAVPAGETASSSLVLVRTQLPRVCEVVADSPVP